MNLISFVIHRKVFVSMVFLGLSMLGYVSYRQLPLELMPNVEWPYLVVQVSSVREVDPEYMEQQAIIPLEGVIGTVDGINSIESEASQRRGTLNIYFDQSVEIGYAYLKLSERIQTLMPQLEDEFSVSVQKVDTERLANMFMRLQVRGSGGLDRVRAVLDKYIIDALESIDGIASVAVSGGEEKAVEITIDEDAVRAYNLTPASVRSLIRQNSAQRAYVGDAWENDRHFFVNVQSDYDHIRELENIVVDPTGPVLLRDVSSIVFGLKEQTSLSRVNGKDAVTITLVRDANVNMIDLSHETRDIITRLNEDLRYQDVEIIIQSDSAEEMETNINLIMELALVGGLLAVAILWFFLRNLRIVLTVMLSIPMSVLVAFNFFYGMDVSINSLTLVGLVLAIGMLLDNSVVVLENIYRHVALGKNRETAVVVGTTEVWRSIVASTLTTITIFLPFIFAEDPLVRILGRHIGISIIATLGVSLFVALILVPMMIHSLLGRPGKRVDSFSRIRSDNRLLQIYTVLLKTGVRSPAWTAAGIAAVFFISVALCLSISLTVPSELQLDEFNMFVNMPRGATLENTDETVKQVEDKLTDIEEIEDVVTTVYEEEASITVALKEAYEQLHQRTVPQIKNMIERRVEDVRSADISMTESRAGGRFSSGMRQNPMSSLERMFGIGTQQEKIIVKGSDYQILRNVAEDIEYYLEDLESIRSVNTSIPGNRPEIHLMLQNNLLSEYEIPVSAVSTELASFQNEVSSGMRFKVGMDEYDITIRNAAVDEEKTFNDLRSLRISGEAEDSYELDQLSRLVYSSGISSVSRLNQEKQIEVTYRFENEINDSQTMLEMSREEISSLLAGLVIPTGVAVEMVKDESEYDEFYFLIGAAFLLIFMILASVFESVTTPIVMMFTIPLATIGSFWALMMTGNSLFNANALVGFLILLGVVVNNGIILIDFTNLLRKRGYRRVRALLTASQARVRPILITSITTIVAMVPLAMGESEYVSHIGASFAITVIGGLTFSTLFTLVFIPTIYSGMESALAWMRGLRWHIKVMQAVVSASALILIYLYVDSVFWQSLYMILVLAAIPGVTWFFTSSLRHARADIFKADETLRISIRRMVKIYEGDNRFVREWKQGERMNRRDGNERFSSFRRAADHWVWQAPVLGFLSYFVYFYLESSGWLFLLSFLVYFFAIQMLKPVTAYFRFQSERTGRTLLRRCASWLHGLLLWGFPAFCLALFHMRDFEIPAIVFIGLVWYATLCVVTLANRLHRLRINIMRLSGRLAGLRRQLYRFIQVIPVLGKRKRPFFALSGVSMEIGSGMFGLLGPNGAGKTTIMRVICGILTQSRGTIRVNHLNILEKREELQGLIGYLPQEFGFYENMTAYEFLDYMGILKSMYNTQKREAVVRYALHAVHLDEHSDRKIGAFSGGMKQRLGIAMALLHLPRILVVDEPTAGLDPRERIRFRNLLVELSRERIVLFSTHIIEDISSSCNQVAVLNKGALYYMGEPALMTRAAQGKVWQMHLTPDEFAAARDTLRVVHHMRLDELILVRCLAVQQPHPKAEPAQPTLEDAYLWLMMQPRAPRPVAAESEPAAAGD